MRQTVIVSAATAVVTVVLNVLVLYQLGADTAKSANEPSSLVRDAHPLTEADGQIQGDVDCDREVDLGDAIKIGLDGIGADVHQTDPCPDIGTVIPLGEGPQGPQGEPGEQGPEGPQGEQGEPGLSGLSIEQDFTPFDGDKEKGLLVLCPAGKEVIAGGHTTQGGVDIQQSRPFGGPGGGWEVSGNNQLAGDWQLVVFAICANVAE